MMKCPTGNPDRPNPGVTHANSTSDRHQPDPDQEVCKRSASNRLTYTSLTCADTPAAASAAVDRALFKCFHSLVSRARAAKPSLYVTTGHHQSTAGVVCVGCSHNWCMIPCLRAKLAGCASARMTWGRSLVDKHEVQVRFQNKHIRQLTNKPISLTARPAEQGVSTHAQNWVECFCQAA